MSSCCHAIVELKTSLQDAIGGNNLCTQLILRCVNAKIAPTSVKELEVIKRRLSLHVVSQVTANRMV